MMHDLRLRRPWYVSDWTSKEDVWQDPETIYKLVSGTIRIYFVNLLPALAYALDMYYRTSHIWGTNEVLLASAVPAVFFALFSCQPLTIVGVTGLIDLFGYTTYDIVTVRYGVDFLGFMGWVGIWSAVMHFAIAIFNWCDYMKYVTDFSSTAFGMYVGIIYIIKGVELVVEEFGEGLSDANGFLSVLIALLYFALTWMTTRIGMSNYLHRYVRMLCTDFSLIIWTIFFAGFAHIPGHLADVNVRKYPISQAFQPTPPLSAVARSYGWFIHFWEIPVKWWFIAIPFAALVTALFYYDHNVSSLMAQARHYPLRKHAGFHWDFFLLGITTLVAGLIGIPYPNGLVPQAPVHTDSCAIMSYPKPRASREDTDFEHDTKNNHDTRVGEHNNDSVASTNSTIAQDSQSSPSKGPTISRILEQRWTHFVMGLLLFGTMTRPLLVALATVPRAVFAGVFITVGFSSIETNPITTRTLNLLLHSPSRSPSHKVSRSATAVFLGLQWLTILIEVAISQTLAAIGFPVVILLLIPLRWRYIERWFPERWISRRELGELDALTAQADVVLESFFGGPVERRDDDEVNAEDGHEKEREGTRAGKRAGESTNEGAGKGAPVTNNTGSGHVSGHQEGGSGSVSVRRPGRQD